MDQWPKYKTTKLLLEHIRVNLHSFGSSLGFSDITAKVQEKQQKVKTSSNCYPSKDTIKNMKRQPMVSGKLSATYKFDKGPVSRCFINSSYKSMIKTSQLKNGQRAWI